MLSSFCGHSQQREYPPMDLEVIGELGVERRAPHVSIAHEDGLAVQRELDVRARSHVNDARR